jgi:hypothetical protein
MERTRRQRWRGGWEEKDMGESRRRMTHGPESWRGRDLRDYPWEYPITDVTTVPPGRNFDSHPMSVDSDNWSISTNCGVRNINRRVICMYSVLRKCWQNLARPASVEPSVKKLCRIDTLEKTIYGSR